MTEYGGTEKKDFNLQDLRMGSPEAFRIFFLNYYGEFFSFANILLRNKPSAKNVTSASFFMLWAKHEDFENERNIKAFLYSSIRDYSLSYLRHLRDNPDSKEYFPETRFSVSLPDELLKELLSYTENFVSHP